MAAKSKEASIATASNSAGSDLDKKRRKEALKAEAAQLGIPYKQLKAEHKDKTKRKNREADELVNEEEQQATKRLRAYSQDLNGGSTASSTARPTWTTTSNATTSTTATSRRRTRSIDLAESERAARASEVSLSVEDWRKLHNITVRHHGATAAVGARRDDDAPFRTFADAPFDDRVQRALTQAGFTGPTPIQAQAWPIALQNKDMICIAKTGSGKTCGFLLPSFTRMLASPPTQAARFPQLLVLAPTRELSVQIMEEAQKFGRRPLGIRPLCCYGGSSKYPQIAALEKHEVDVIIATPGRLNDLIDMKKCDLRHVKYLVLDEADRMLDMGFEPQIRSIVKHVPTQRQTLLFSATWPKEIQTLAHDFLQDSVQINVGEVNSLVANTDIDQTIVMCDEDDKFEKLKEILTTLQNEHDDDHDKTKASPAGGGKDHAKIIVFVAKKVSCNDLANHLWDEGFAVDSLHGDRPQWERTRVIQAFKSGQLRMLIATDVAARGLDVKDVGVVVNYDMPHGVNGVEDYVHRIGRTGRAGAKGKAYTFFTRGDKKVATQLVQVLHKGKQDVPPELQAMVRPPPRFQRGGGGRYGATRGGRGYTQQGRGYMGGGGSGGRGGRYASPGGGGRGFGGRAGADRSFDRGRGGRGRF